MFDPCREQPEKKVPANRGPKITMQYRSHGPMVYD
jgi:hypothetical protein